MTDARKPRARLILWVAVAAVAILAVALTLVLGDPAAPSTVTIATGDPAGTYHARASELVPHVAAGSGPTLKLVATKGTGENLEALRRGRVDAAFASSGFVAAELARTPAIAEELRAIARLYAEPIWIFAHGGIRVLTDLAPTADGRKRRIIVGVEGSASRATALELLALGGVTAANAEFLALDQTAGVEAMQRKEADVIIRVAGVTSPAIQKLVRIPDVTLVSFDNHRAYTQRLPHLSAVTIDQGQLAIAENVPARPITLLATSAMLLVREDAHPRIVERLTKAATAVFCRGDLLDTRGTYPSRVNLELPQHDAAMRFMRDGESWASRTFSFRTLQIVAYLKLLLIPLVSVLPAFRIVPAIILAVSRRRLNKLYARLRAVHASMTQAKTGDELDALLALVTSIEEDVNRLALKLPAASQDLVYQLRLHVKIAREDLAARRTETAA